MKQVIFQQRGGEDIIFVQTFTRLTTKFHKNIKISF
uniref:Uncharacterized protein n=1 Tax=Rhizophora mucronata TaxID=61149 RepID=A0A2P2MXW5_RHIMU